MLMKIIIPEHAYYYGEKPSHHHPTTSLLLSIYIKQIPYRKLQLLLRGMDKYLFKLQQVTKWYSRDPEGVSKNVILLLHIKGE